MLQRQVGDIVIHRIIESERPDFDAAGFFPQVTPEQWAPYRERLAGWALDRKVNGLVFPMQSFLVRTRHHIIVVDTCVGDHKERARPNWNMTTSGEFLQRFAETGVRPEQVDFVLTTHFHTDHVGWNTRWENDRWVPTFPNARYLISRREWDHWQAAGMAALARTGDYITDSVLPVFAAGQADLVGDEHAIASEISVELAPGHTPGQMMVRLGSGHDQAILSADLMHHPLQVRYPEWSTRFCTDPAQARTTRINFFNEQANTGRLIFPAHFPSPTGGTIERNGKGFRFIFDGEI